LPTSRSLSARTFSSAPAFATSSPFTGMKADIPPIAKAPRRWHVATSRSEERLIHRHLAAVGCQPVGRAAAALYGREDVIPAAAVEADDILTKRVEDLVHLERRRQRLDQHGRLDRPALEPELGLGEGEDVVPQRSLLHALQLGEVEIRAGAFGERRASVVPEIDGEIEQSAGDYLAVHGHM